jgi:soluble lytic murein transglycosylase-like protein
MSWQMPGIDWHWLKAQCYQESRFKPNAVSPVGASGVCQFMPATWNDVPLYIRQSKGVFDARTNIEAAAWYDSKLYRFWYSPRPVEERIKLMLASYNAGAQNIAKAQKLCSMAPFYDTIIKCLPDVTRHHSKETIDYVKKIQKFKHSLNR